MAAPLKVESTLTDRYLSRGYIAMVGDMSDGHEVKQWLEMAKQLVDDRDPISSETFATIVGAIYVADLLGSNSLLSCRRGVIGFAR